MTILHSSVLALALGTLAIGTAGCSSDKTGDGSTSSSSGTSGASSSSGGTSGTSGTTSTSSSSSGQTCSAGSLCINGSCKCTAGPNKDGSCQKTDTGASDFCDTFCKYCQ